MTFKKVVVLLIKEKRNGKELNTIFYLAVLGHIKMCTPPYFIWPFSGI